jgi:hypothetical protein
VNIYQIDADGVKHQQVRVRPDWLGGGGGTFVATPWFFAVSVLVSAEPT